MKFSEWEAKYKPIQNPFTNDGNIMFETYGEQLAYVKAADQLKVWTLTDGLSVHAIYNGMRPGLRHYITEEAFEEGDFIEIITSTEEECDCYSEETGEADPDCGSCEGWGWRVVEAD